MNNNLKEPWSLSLKYEDSKYFIGLIEDHTLTNMFRTKKMVLLKMIKTQNFKYSSIKTKSHKQN